MRLPHKQLEGVKADQLLSNNITAVTDPTASQDISQGYFPSSVWVNTAASPKKVFVCSDNSIGSAVWNQIAPTGGQTVTQVLHGFTVGQVLKHSGGTYALAQADTQANIGIWLVTAVIDANTFQIVQSGYVTGLTGGTADETWYLSDTTAGGLVNVAPAIAQPIIYWITASEGWVLGYPATSSGVLPAGSVPIGSVMAWDKYHQSTPLVLPSDMVECNGQTISDISSPYNGKRIRNLNASTVSAVVITAIDDINKIITVALADVSAFSVGDTLSFTGASVPNAVVSAVNETTGEITVGDSLTWFAGYVITSYSLAGATDVSSVGQPRFLRGSGVSGSDVNQMQGHFHQITSDPNTIMMTNSLGGFYAFASGSNVPISTNSTLQAVSDGVNGTPRTGQKTHPDYNNIVWVLKYK